MIKYPPYLEKGDTIGIICPAGYMDTERVAECIRVLTAEWGFQVKVGKTVGSESQNYFSGTDEERLEDLQMMLDDTSIKAVLCARGGYGMGRIIDRISFKKFKKHPKWIIGFSDITVLHTHIYTNYYIATLHAPMAAAFNDGGYINEYVQSLKSALQGDKIRYQCEAHPLNIKGEGIGELVGGNLALLTHLIGTDSDLKTRGKILFIEDVGEYLYTIDRMFYQLKRSKKLSRLAGLIIGGFTDCKDTDRPFGQSAYDIIHEHTRDADYPVCFGFPVSHEKENYALKVGVGYKLRVTKNKVYLEE
ncbi:MAG: LD-carboxypeptidase [Terrimonas sp.]|nr:LD-carboxypeptidase [Terrimonas sp.]